MSALPAFFPEYQTRVAAELRRREATHGLALLCINFGSPEQVRRFGAEVLPLLRRV